MEKERIIIKRHFVLWSYIANNTFDVTDLTPYVLIERCVLANFNRVFMLFLLVISGNC